MSKAIYKDENGILYISDRDFEFYNDAAQYYGEKYKLIGMLQPDRILTDVTKRQNKRVYKK